MRCVLYILGVCMFENVFLLFTSPAIWNILEWSWCPSELHLSFSSVLPLAFYHVQIFNLRAGLSKALFISYSYLVIFYLYVPYTFTLQSLCKDCALCPPIAVWISAFRFLLRYGQLREPFLYCPIYPYCGLFSPHNHVALYVYLCILCLPPFLYLHPQCRPQKADYICLGHGCIASSCNCVWHTEKADKICPMIERSHLHPVPQPMQWGLSLYIFLGANIWTYGKIIYKFLLWYRGTSLPRICL